MVKARNTGFWELTGNWRQALGTSDLIPHNFIVRFRENTAVQWTPTQPLLDCVKSQAQVSSTEQMVSPFHLCLLSRIHLKTSGGTCSGVAELGSVTKHSQWTEITSSKPLGLGFVCLQLIDQLQSVKGVFKSSKCVFVFSSKINNPLTLVQTRKPAWNCYALCLLVIEVCRKSHMDSSDMCDVLKALIVLSSKTSLNRSTWLDINRTVCFEFLVSGNWMTVEEWLLRWRTLPVFILVLSPVLC